MKSFKRLFFSAVLTLSPSLSFRMRLIKQFRLFGSVGQNCKINSKIIPLYSNLVFIHDNVIIGSRCNFVTHDVIHFLLNKKLGGGRFY